jgi:hypothetical protein
MLVMNWGLWFSPQAPGFNRGAHDWNRHKNRLFESTHPILPWTFSELSQLNVKANRKPATKL